MIEQLLSEIKEDKFQNFSTTSFKMKTDIWNFFNEDRFKRLNCVEFGTHKGQTTRILAHLFNKVYTINLPNHFDSAMELNRDLDNIEYIPLDLYQTSVEDNFKHRPISVIFIDAGHEFDNVMMDITRALNFKLSKEVYFIFDDYGQESRGVWMAVNQMVQIGKFEKVKYIGHPPRFSFGGNPERKLADHEGIIVKLK